MNVGGLAGVGSSVSVVNSDERILAGVNAPVPAANSGEWILAGADDQIPAVSSGEQAFAGGYKNPTVGTTQKNQQQRGDIAPLLLVLCLLQFPLASASEQIGS